MFLIENNHFGLSGRVAGEVTGIDFLARRGWGYKLNGMHAEVVNGMDVLAMREAVLRAAAICRAKDGPVLLEAMTYRYMGHSLSDQSKYRNEEEIEAWKAKDPIKRFRDLLVAEGTLTEKQADNTKNKAYGAIDAAVAFADASPEPTLDTIEEGVYA